MRIHAFLTENSGGVIAEGREEALKPLVALFESESVEWTWGSAAMAYLEFICIKKPFPDKNKQVALLTAEIFLNLNGKTMNLTEAEAVQLVRDVAEKKLQGAALAGALRGRIENLSE